MKTKSNQNRFLRIISIPLRALGKARDLYVRGMTNYADRGSCYGGKLMGIPPSNSGGNLPRSFSATSSRSNDSEDFRELLRAASTRTLAETNSADLSLYIQQEMMLRRKQHLRGTASVAAAIGGGGMQKMMPPRSCSVGMGRIDEDKPCSTFSEEEEEEDYNHNRKQKKSVYPRSRSYAVTTTTTTNNNNNRSLAF